MEPLASERAAAPRRPPEPPIRSRSALSRSRARRLIASLRGTPRLIAQLSVGCGLDPLEVLRLELRDLDLERRRIRVRRGSKRGRRCARIPSAAWPELVRLLAVVRRVHAADAARGRAGTTGGRLRQWLFPDPSLEADPRTGELVRPHLDPRRLERSFDRAARESGRRLTIRTNVHTLA